MAFGGQGCPPYGFSGSLKHSSTNKVKLKTKNGLFLSRFFIEILVARGRIELPTHGFSVRCSTDWAIWPYFVIYFQNNTSLARFAVLLILSSTSPPCLVLKLNDNLFLTGCGGRIWTYDLRVMSPTSYHAAPPRVSERMRLYKLFTMLSSIYIIRLSEYNRVLETLSKKAFRLPETRLKIFLI